MGSAVSLEQHNTPGSQRADITLLGIVCSLEDATHASSGLNGLKALVTMLTLARTILKRSRFTAHAGEVLVRSAGCVLVLA